MTPLLLAGMPWGILMPVFLLGVVIGLVRARQQ